MIGANVSRETSELLQRYEDAVREENTRQNLVAAPTLTNFRERHVTDALQLCSLVPTSARIADVGSGAGLPGMVLAITRRFDVTMIEPRRLRADFLERLLQDFVLGDVARVLRTKVEAAAGTFDVITARAVAPLPRLFAMAHHLADPATLWVLPKGRTAASELAEARKAWQGRFELIPSQTDPEARIVVARGVTRRASR